jgi:branched-chain amino acid transport system permease protein
MAALQVCVDGVFTGAVYAVAAVGLTLILSVGRVVNLAHGGFFALGAYIAYEVTFLGLPALLGAAPAALAGLLLGSAVDRAVVRPLHREALSVAIVLLGLAILAEGGFALVWGTSSHSVPHRLPTLIVGGVVVGVEQTAAAAIAALCLGAVGLYLRTRPGLAMRAAGADAEITAVAGVDVERLRTATFGVACAMAATAGALLSPQLTLSPTMGRAPLVLSLAMAAAGGPDRLWATIAASFGVGLASTIATFYLDPAWSYILALVILMAALIWRADGMLGGMRP